MLAILNAAQLVTVAGPCNPRTGHDMGQLAIIEHGGMLVDDAGLIAAVGTSEEIAKQAGPSVDVVDAGNCVVLPGFVDAHTHLVFAGDRIDEYELRAKGATYEQIATAGGGIRRTVRLTREASEESLLMQARKHAEWFLAGGTTTVEAKSGYGLCMDAELKILRVSRRVGEETALEVVPTFLGAHACPSEYGDDKDAYVDHLVHDILPKVAERGLAEYCDVFCERNYFTREQSRRVLEAARALGLGLRIHADQLTCNGGAELAAELGAKTADHLEQTEEEGIRAMANGGVQPVLLPGSVYALGHERYPKARAMIDAGLAVVLATDFNPGSSPTTSMPMILSLACTHMGMTPAETVCAATINAAHSLGRGGRLGSLEVGKEADFTIFRCADYREIPYYFGLNLVGEVYKGGKIR